MLAGRNLFRELRVVLQHVHLRGACPLEQGPENDIQCTLPEAPTGVCAQAGRPRGTEEDLQLILKCAGSSVAIFRTIGGESSYQSYISFHWSSHSTSTPPYFSPQNAEFACQQPTRWPPPSPVSHYRRQGAHAEDGSARDEL